MNCKVCGEFKIRLADGKYPNSRNSRFVDECNKEWMGRTCPNCNIERSKKLMRQHRMIKGRE